MPPYMPTRKAIVTKERILERVLPIFLVNNYEVVTINMIEDATRMCRGTVYRHFINKEDLFLQSSQRFYDSPLNVFFAMKPEGRTLLEYWNAKMRQLVNASEYLKGYGITLDPCAISNYIGVQTSLVAPEFRDIMTTHAQLNIRYWSIVLRNTPGFEMHRKKISYRAAGQIYHGAYIQRCSTYPNCLLKIPDLSFR